MPGAKKALSVERKNGEIFSHMRRKWLVETPEERVRQDYLCVLVNEYGFALEQIDEELTVTGRGGGDARADFLIWRTPQEKADKKTALIVVECKADNVTIDNRTYFQGANYAQYERAKFFVTHNNRETKYWKVDLERRMPNFDEIEDIPHAEATDKEIEEIISRLKVFREDEFADLLHQCHNIIRNREKLDPAAAFDEIAKILFVKVCFERRLRDRKQRKNLFTADFLDEQKVYTDPIDNLFRDTKEEYRADKIFAADEKINLKFNTVRDIVKKLERYNLSDTSEDVNGCDANDRMARTSKMNMIMHGDGHGGVHHHDGFVDVNGIFEERFNIVLTNPPFGANVEDSDTIEEAHVAIPEDVERKYKTNYGKLYEDAINKVRAAVGKPILDLFDLPRTGRIKTEILFMERCLALLKPGGKLGIVLPEGIFNNPSLAYVREYCEDRAFIRAVVSLPQETFFSSGASVKASLLFMQKFTEKEKAQFDALKAKALAETEEKYKDQKAQLQGVLAQPNVTQQDAIPDGIKNPSKEEKTLASEKAKEANAKLKEEKDQAKKALKELEDIITKEARAFLKVKFSYPIFMYEAEKVGITATGEADYNELYPNDNMPLDVGKSCLELYRAFRMNSEKQK